MSDSRARSTRFAMRDHNRLAYDVSDPIGGADGTRGVLFLHDLLADRGAFSGIRDALALDLRTIAADCRGHGASASLRNQWYSIAELASDVDTILDAERVQNVDLVGHGLGGTVAFDVVRRSPGRVLSLILIEPSLYPMLENDHDPDVARLRTDWRAADRQASDAAYKEQTDLALNRYLRPRWGDAWRDETPKPRIGAIRRHAGALAGLLPALDALIVPRSELAKIDLPVVIVLGADALEIDRLVADRLTAGIPLSRVVQMPLGPRSGYPLSGETAPALAELVITAVSGSR